MPPLSVDSFHCLSDFLKLYPTVFLIPAGGKHKALRRWFLEGWWGRAKRLELLPSLASVDRLGRNVHERSLVDREVAAQSEEFINICHVISAPWLRMAVD